MSHRDRPAQVGVLPLHTEQSNEHEEDFDDEDHTQHGEQALDVQEGGRHVEHRKAALRQRRWRGRGSYELSLYSARYINVGDKVEDLVISYGGNKTKTP